MNLAFNEVNIINLENLRKWRFILNVYLLSRYYYSSFFWYLKYSLLKILNFLKAFRKIY